MLEFEEYNRDYEDILNEAMAKLKDNTEITNFSSGSIARALLEVYAEPLSNFHDQLTKSIAMRFVSTAKGPYLSEIGKLFNMQKREGESDDNFRYRIIHASESLAEGNKIAIRLAVLSVDGVIDLRIKKYTRGTGSFDVYVITADPKNDQDILDEVQEVLDSKESFGVSGNVLNPVLVDFSISVNLIFYDEVNQDRRNELRENAKSEISNYISDIILGKTFIVSELIARVMGIDESSDNDEIKDMIITSMSIDGDQVTITNQSFKWDERAVPTNITVK